MPEQKNRLLDNKTAQTGVLFFLGLVLAWYLQKTIEVKDVVSFWNLSLIPMLIYCPLLYLLAWKAYSRFLADLYRLERSYTSRLDLYSYLPTLLLLQYYRFSAYTKGLFEQRLLELVFFSICIIKILQFVFLLVRTRKLALRAFFRPITLAVLLLIPVATFAFIRAYDYLLYRTIESRLIVTPKREISINNELRRVLYSPSPYFPGPNRIEKEMRLPEDATLSVGMGIGRNSWFQSDTGVEFRILIRNGVNETLLFSRYVDPQSNPNERGWIDELIDLSEYSGQDVTIVFETELPYSEVASLKKILKSSFGFTRWRNIGKYGNIVEAVWSEPKIFSKGHAEGPNVILISFDTLGAPHLSCYGYQYNTTPTLDSFASEGVLFRYCVAQSNWTLSSHVSLLTAQNCGTHAVLDDRYRLNDSFVTLAEVFRDHGYQTAAITEGGNVASSFGFDQGFETYDNGTGHSIKRTFSKAYHWLEQRRAGKFFLFVHTYETHASYEKRNPYYSRPGRDYTGLIRGDLRFLLTPKRSPYYLRPEDSKELRTLYDSEVSYIDAHFNDFMDTLRALGLLPGTTVIVTSDHGEGFGEHHYFGHGNTLYDELLLVPLIIKGPDLPEGMVIDQQVRSIDIMPTVLELYRLAIPEDLDGVSLLPLLRGEQMSVPPAISAVDNSGYGPSRKSIRTDTMKLILVEGQAKSEIYDLGRDPREDTNLADTENAEAGSLQDQLIASLEASEEKKVRIVGQEAQKATLDQSIKEQLEALGYVE